MDYEKAYKKALERAKSEWVNNLDNAYKNYRERLGIIFPELVESEDERIRKELISFVNNDGWKFTKLTKEEKESWIDWLEKQAPKAIHEEKVDNANKVEPKFKVGDWIVSDYNNVAYIESIGETKYNLQCKDRYHEKMSIEYIDRCWHLWTIQDAKDGDVLINGSNIFIFHFLNDTRLMGYCHINTDDGRFYNDLGKNECFCLIDAVVTPVTQEQRNFLFTKMREAGYDWNSEKKELMKIEKQVEQKPKWTEEDEIKVDDVIYFLDTAKIHYASTEALDDCIDWLKSLKQRMEE